MVESFDKACMLNENGRMKKQYIQLGPTDQEFLESLTRQGEQEIPVLVQERDAKRIKIDW